MKCPHCEYEHTQGHHSDEPPYDWIDRVGYEVFFQMVVPMEQPETDRNYAVRKTLYACPECGKAFIDLS